MDSHPPNQSPPPTVSSMDAIPGAAADDLSSVWEWGSLLDFSLDDEPDLLPWPSTSPNRNLIPDPTPPPSAPATAAANRVRKRDPRLVCENYLAGRVPCACPELDKLAAEEEEAAQAVAGSRKRARAAAGVVRCQVPGCEADISELKGYHRRHRVCLRCANASSVLLEGENRRYCQQCGKFHVLPDFDEGKRSCRRKLEKHNKRRRRKPTDLVSVADEPKEHKDEPSVDTCSHGEPAKVEARMKSKMRNVEVMLESENGHRSPSSPFPNSHNGQSDSVFSLPSSGDFQIDERLDNTKSGISSAFCENKSTYSSVCPTGRISFKLYDWNPAEFPRRLRHQIFQWLANMPVELEGYIRPGCTILTIFIAMPKFMWEKLSQEGTVFVRDLIQAPESLLAGRGNFFIYFSNKLVQVMKDGTTLMNIKMEVQVPKLHYVYPTYFEAGQPMEFLVCGSNIDQPKFRFLVSFNGRYLEYNSCCIISQGKMSPYHIIGSSCHQNHEHEIYKISIIQTDAGIFGPAFIEVENESGLSNFIPVLFGKKEVCSELEKMQETLGKSVRGDKMGSQIELPGADASSCKLFSSKQTIMSELLLDIAWLLKVPDVDTITSSFSSFNIQRLTSLLDFLIENELVAILDEVMKFMDKNTLRRSSDKLSIYKCPDADRTLLERKISFARAMLNGRVSHDHKSELESRSSFTGGLYPVNNQDCSLKDTDAMKEDATGSTTSTTSEGNNEKIPLVSEDAIYSRQCFADLSRKRSGESWLSGGIVNRRITLFVLVGVVMCFGACVALLHPHKAGEFAVTIRRCLFGSLLDNE